ncbi:hypothetical protein WN55_08253 [Dufourea novaeangliae]|uniref:Uncharacterized protein n=1 Tax=Dufourea novaeangliae TaxID=178035 RepID=A0A154P6J1_DUFNO|nr:hypothetical protein WN55_08253 [Dufourea novaeangliae]
MDTSPTLSIGGSRARAALLTTSGTGTGSADRRVVFLASQPAVGTSHETKTWPHHWSPHTKSIAMFERQLTSEIEGEEEAVGKRKEDRKRVGESGLNRSKETKTRGAYHGKDFRRLLESEIDCSAITIRCTQPWRREESTEGRALLSVSAQYL